MRSSKYLFFALLLVVLAGCGGGGGGDTSSSPPPPSGGGQPNVLAITVNGTPSYPNKPTVSVTLCTPGTTSCQTIDNILLDTGSFGLRVFKQALGVPLTQVTAGAISLAECIPFLDGMGMWGPVQLADVVLGGEKAAGVPIQVIDAAFGGVPTACQPPNVTGLDQDPAIAGFNGILGVGLFIHDCGQGCTVSPANGVYFACSGTNCSGTAAPLASQVQNPVALLAQDNNGVIVQLPTVPQGGAQTVSGQLILGIGTQTNNSPGAVTSFPADLTTGEFTTVFNGTTYGGSFIDSGSNGLFFSAPASLLPPCAAPNASWYCPSATTNFIAVNSGAPSVSFQIGNASSLFSSSNRVFSELGGSAVVGNSFDWGIPFFFNRNVAVGIEGRSSSLGTGPYWAY